MAITTLLTANKSIYIDSTNPDESFEGSPIKLLESDTSLGTKKAFLTFDTSPLIEGKKITGITLKLYITKKNSNNISLGYKYIDAFVHSPNQAPDIDSITYNTTNRLEEYDFNSFLDLGKVDLNSYTNANLRLGDLEGMFKAALVQPLGLNIPKTFTGYQNYSIEAEFLSADSLHPPQIEVVQEDATLFIKYLRPQNRFVNSEKEVTFTWEVYNDSYNLWGKLHAASGLIRYRPKGEAEYIEIFAEGNSYTFPPNTLPIGDVEWQVEITSNAGTTTTSNWFTVTTIDSAAIATPLTPKNTQLLRENENIFTWNHTTEYGTEQTAADLEISVDGLNWQSLATVTGAEKSVIIPADTLPLGTVFWRVRTYNANNVVGAWSESAIIIVAGAVPVPEISSVLGGAKPVISWSAQTQQGYQAQIKDINDEIVVDSFAQLGTDKSHIFNTLLDDGVYVARVRVYADNGNVSDWAQYSFTISTTKPQPPSLTVQSKEGCVVLTATAEAGNTVYILRDGVVIGRAKSNVFYDWTSSGQSKYIAREVNSQNAFADSKVVTASPIIYGSLLASANNPSEIVPLKYNLGGYPAREMAWSPMGGGAHYAGKNYPDYQFTQQSDESYNFSFAFKTRQEYERFMRLANSRDIILYRDQYGLKFYGVITGVSPSVQWSGWAITFSMTRVNYLEAIDYGG